MKGFQMRIAAIYDIHGNFPALQAVVAEISKASIDLILVGGDVIAGPMPVETLQLLEKTSKKIPMQFIHGNAESELIRFVNGKDINGLTKNSEAITHWLAKELNSEQIEFISTWAKIRQLKLDNGKEILFCHATPDNDIDIFTQLSLESELIPVFKNLKASIVICGHTHMQFDREIANIRVINAGSVGMPFGHTGADWLIIDNEISFMHSDYNLEKAAISIRKTNYPQADQFANNNVLNSVSKTTALKMLSQLAANQK